MSSDEEEFFKHLRELDIHGYSSSEEDDSDPDMETEQLNINIDAHAPKKAEATTQTDDTTTECGVNTEVDWLERIQAMRELLSSATKEKECQARKAEEELELLEMHEKQLEMEKEDVIQQHQVLMGKLEALRVKLQLNDSKADKKSFQNTKKQLTAEKIKIQKETDGLAKKLEETEKELLTVTEQHSRDKKIWQEELEELAKKLDESDKELQEAKSQALKDEVAAQEIIEEFIMELIDFWLEQVDEYLNGLMFEFPDLYKEEKLIWDKKRDSVQAIIQELRNSLKKFFELRDEGVEFDDFLGFVTPHLPQVPLAELEFQRIMRSLISPPITPSLSPSILSPQPTTLQEHQLVLIQHPTTTEVCHSPPSQNFVNVQPPILSQDFYGIVPPPLAQPHVRPTSSPSQTPSPPVQPAAVSQTPPPSPASSGTLDKLMDKLGAKFPNCSKSQLMSLLQQIKSSRGTLAGMPLDMLIEQIALMIAQTDKLDPGPIQRPRPQQPIQRPTPSKVGGEVRKLCLMCQNHVDQDSQYKLSCSHIIHKDCIQMWLQSSKKNSCPFCPAN